MLVGTGPDEDRFGSTENAVVQAKLLKGLVGVGI